MLNKNRICGLFLVLIGFIGWYMVSGFNARLIEGDPGPQLFPMISLIGMIVCGLIIFFQRVPDEEPYLTKEGWKKTAALFGVFIVYVLLLKYFGYIISTLGVLFVITSMFSKGKNVSIVKRIIFTVIITLSVYVLFVRVLRVMLPTGVWF